MRRTFGFEFYTQIRIRLLQPLKYGSSTGFSFELTAFDAFVITVAHSNAAKQVVSSLRVSFHGLPPAGTIGGLLGTDFIGTSGAGDVKLGDEPSSTDLAPVNVKM